MPNTARSHANAPPRVLLGVSGGIAAYKAAELVRRLREHGAEVRVVMTAAAERFVAAATFHSCLFISMPIGTHRRRVLSHV